MDRVSPFYPWGNARSFWIFSAGQPGFSEEIGTHIRSQSKESVSVHTRGKPECSWDIRFATSDRFESLGVFRDGHRKLAANFRVVSQRYPGDFFLVLG